MKAEVSALPKAKPAAKIDTRRLHKKHHLAVRWFHWINFPVLFCMIWSGLLIYWANRAFYIRLPGFTWGPLFPDNWYSLPAPSWLVNAPKWIASPLVTDMPDDNGKVQHLLWSFDARLAEGMGWHFLFAWIFTINGICYVLYLMFSKQWKYIVPKPKAIVEAIQVVLVDLYLSKKKLPVRKYNAAQQIAYTVVIIMGAVMVLTGIAIYKPSNQAWLTGLFGGYTVARFIHFWTTMGFLAFFVIHVGQVIKTGWNNFRGMITGYELVSPEEKEILESKA